MINSQKNQMTEQKEINAESLLNPLEPKSFLERLPDIIPFLDPDSTRFLDWISAYRMKDGRSTATHYFTLPEEYKVHKGYAVELKDLIEIAREQIGGNSFTHEFIARDSYRGFVLNEKQYPEFYFIAGETGGSKYIVSATGDEEVVNKIMEVFKERFVIPKSVKVTRLINFTQQGADTRENQLREEDCFQANDAFYPYIDGGIDKLAQDFKDSKANAMLFIGEPGVGKSTLLRSLFFKMGYDSVYSVSNEHVLTNPSFMSWIESADEDSLVCIEDADNLVLPRSSGNKQMSALLSSADGTVPNNRKLVISTNLPSIRDVDEAMVRPGRCFKIIEFRKLSVYEANVARQSIGLDVVDFGDNAHISLAEALNWTNLNDKQKRVANSSIGFVEA